MKTSYLSVFDGFCGAGGTSVGVKRAGGDIVVAVNHWPTACNTYEQNHAGVRVVCTNLSICDPWHFRSTTVGVFSPECTFHTLAKGEKRKIQQQLDMWEDHVTEDPTAKRSRQTMWDVVRFSEYHQYEIVIVENVVEAKWYWPTYNAWLHAMHDLGYDHKEVFLNSMFCWPTPQSRDRMYVVFYKRSIGRVPDLDIKPPAWCEKCGKNVASVQSWKNPTGRKSKIPPKSGRYRKQYVYRCPLCAAEIVPYYFCAANAIDFSLPIVKIGEREQHGKQPLKPNTIRRIEAGLKKFRGRSNPFMWNMDQNRSPQKLRDIFGDTWPTQTTADVMALAYPPYLMKVTGNPGDHLTTLDGPMPTVTTFDDQAMVVHMHSHSNPTSLYDPLNTIYGQVPHAGIVQFPPFVTSQYNRPNSQSEANSPLDAPLPTQGTWKSHYLVVPPGFVAELHGNSPSHMYDETMSTITTTGPRQALVTVPQGHIASYYSSDTGSPLDAALPTVVTKDRHALVTHDSIDVNECGFRMIVPHEIHIATGFPVAGDPHWPDGYPVTGDRDDQIKQYGNAVSPEAMHRIYKRAIAILN